MSVPEPRGSRSRPTLSIIDVWAWAHTPGVLLTIPSVGLTGVYLCLMRQIVSTSAGQGPARQLSAVKYFPKTWLWSERMEGQVLH